MSVDTAYLISKVRAAIGEPYSNDDQLRSDPEITSWLEDSQQEYVARCPVDSFPNLVTEATFTGSSWTIATDFLKLLSVKLTHITSGTESEITTAFVLPVDAGYVAEQYDGGLGAWAQFRQGIIKVGPNSVSGTICYMKRPTTLATGCPVFPLGDEHVAPVVDGAIVRALAKVNDSDVPIYTERFEKRIAAEWQKFGMALDVEKQD